MYVIEFSPNALKPAAFVNAGIDCPESIQRNVYKRQPVWPSCVIGSITHTHGLAAAVAGCPGVCRGIGIDAKQVIDQDTCQSISSVVVKSQEIGESAFFKRAFTTDGTHHSIFRQGKLLL